MLAESDALDITPEKAEHFSVSIFVEPESFPERVTVVLALRGDGGHDGGEGDVDDEADWRFGQSPAGDGCAVTFDEIRYLPERLADLRDGS